MGAASSAGLTLPAASRLAHHLPGAAAAAEQRVGLLVPRQPPPRTGFRGAARRGPHAFHGLVTGRLSPAPCLRGRSPGGPGAGELGRRGADRPPAHPQGPARRPEEGGPRVGGVPPAETSGAGPSAAGWPGGGCTLKRGWVCRRGCRGTSRGSGLCLRGARPPSVRVLPSRRPLYLVSRVGLPGERGHRTE